MNVTSFLKPGQAAAQFALAVLVITRTAMANEINNVPPLNPAPAGTNENIVRLPDVVVQGRQVVPVWVVRQWKKPLGFLAGLRKPGDSPWRRRKPDAPPRRKTARDIFKTRSNGVAEHGASIPSDFAFHRRPFAVELNGCLTPANGNSNGSNFKNPQCLRGC